MAAKQMTDSAVLSKVEMILRNEVEFLRGLDYPTARRLRREYERLAQRVAEMAEKKRKALRR
jgi:hemerythrin